MSPNSPPSSGSATRSPTPETTCSPATVSLTTSGNPPMVRLTSIIPPVATPMAGS
ncbi:unnamed protein product [Musa acuminata subsp. malaccensis]|uniref:(wild Malaysian banana) hypothetical protein n=1 Tax=Musa acuminata subsp. malaccensis TaxID=214687 RepID=A0A804IGI5_MUSAM|nr:unnamed protein product [Musa acuminata subsp. malaccensis]